MKPESILDQHSKNSASLQAGRVAQMSDSTTLRAPKVFIRGLWSRLEAISEWWLELRFWAHLQSKWIQVRHYSNGVTILITRLACWPIKCAAIST